MTTPRLPDWQARFGALCAERHAMPFAWASNDCILFAADCILACTGVDPAAGHRDYPADALGAARMLATFGGVSEVGDAFAGAPIPLLMAFVGDIGLIESEGRDCLAVCNGTTWLAPGVSGLVVVPFDRARRAWRF